MMDMATPWYAPLKRSTLNIDDGQTHSLPPHIMSATIFITLSGGLFVFIIGQSYSITIFGSERSVVPRAAPYPPPDSLFHTMVLQRTEKGFLKSDGYLHSSITTNLSLAMNV